MDDFCAQALWAESRSEDGCTSQAARARDQSKTSPRGGKQMLHNETLFEEVCRSTLKQRCAVMLVFKSMPSIHSERGPSESHGSPGRETQIRIKILIGVLLSINVGSHFAILHNVL